MQNNFLNLELVDNKNNLQKYMDGLESVFSETHAMLVDLETITSARAAGLLSDIGAKMFAKKVDAFADKLGLDIDNQEAGLQSYSGNTEAGLESVMNSIKKGLQTVYAWIEKALANVAKFISDVYTRIVTGTRGIEKKLARIDEKLKENSSSVMDINGNKYVEFIDKSVALLSIAGLVDNWNKPKMMFAALGDVIECMSESKLPVIEKDADGTLAFKISNPPHIEQLFLKELGKIKKPWFFMDEYFSDFDDPLGTKEKVKPTDVETRIVAIKADAVEFVHYEKHGRLKKLNSDGIQFSVKSNAPRIDLVLSLETNMLTHLSDQISKGVKAIKTVRTENDKRINELKNFSNQALKQFDQSIVELEKGGMKNVAERGMSGRFKQLTSELSSIWNAYPSIANSTIVNLYFNINRTTNFLDSITDGITTRQAEMNTTSGGHRSNGQLLLK